MHHLLVNYAEYHNPLREASVFQMPRQLLTMFATICAYCQPTNAHQLLETYKHAMIENYQEEDHERLENEALHVINNVLVENGNSCSRVGLPQLSGNANVTEVQVPVMSDIDQLTNAQREIVTVIINSVMRVSAGDTSQPSCFYVNAPGGLGKTLVFNFLCDYVRAIHHAVSSAAWTGIAATLISGVKTVHCLFKLPVPIIDAIVCNISPTSDYASFIRNQIVFIIDEASMISVHALSAIDRCLGDVTGVDIAFGGKVISFGGDFVNCYQLYHETFSKYTRKGKCFAFLLELRHGRLAAEGYTSESEVIEVPNQTLVEHSLVNEVFSNETQYDYASRIMLTPKKPESH